MQENDKFLPAYALLKSKCHSSHGNHLAYQSSPTEIRLIELEGDFKIRREQICIVDSQPIRQIQILEDLQSTAVYLGIAFLTKCMIYCEKTVSCKFDLRLQENIADFKNGFVACAVMAENGKKNFVFITSDCSIFTIPTLNPQGNQRITSMRIQNRAASMCVAGDNLAIGCENGSIVLIHQPTTKIINHYDSNSRLPILNILSASKWIYGATCEGEIHIFTEQLNLLKVVPSHYGLISLFHTSMNRLFSFGEDFLLRSYRIGSDGSLDCKSSTSYKRKINLIFTVVKKTYVNLYEDTNLIQIE